MKALNKCYYCKKELHAGQITKVGRKERHNACHECYKKVLHGEITVS